MTAIGTAHSGPDRFSPQPPPAWLIIENTAVAATYGSYCWRDLLRATCADTVGPEGMRELAIARITNEMQLQIVLAASAAEEVHMQIRGWNTEATRDAPNVRVLQVDQALSRNSYIAFPVEISGPLDNHLLEVFVRYESGRDASYFWHLNPVP